MLAQLLLVIFHMLVSKCFTNNCFTFDHIDVILHFFEKVAH